jgi:chemotaxis protein MotA
MASNLENVVHEDGHYLVCIKTGLLAVYKGFPPAIAVEFARRVLPGDVRPTFEETEQYCKQAGKGEAQAAAA